MQVFRCVGVAVGEGVRGNGESLRAQGGEKALGVAASSPLRPLPARHQPRHLRPAVAAHMAQIGQHHAPLCAVQAGVAKPPEQRSDPRIALAVSVTDLELEFMGSRNTSRACCTVQIRA